MPADEGRIEAPAEASPTPFRPVRGRPLRHPGSLPWRWLSWGPTRTAAALGFYARQAQLGWTWSQALGGAIGTHDFLAGRRLIRRRAERVE